MAVIFLDRAPATLGPSEDAILFVRWDAKLGDTVVLSWVWRAIRAHRPDLKIWVVTGSGFYELFDRVYAFDKVVLSPKRPSLLTILRMARQIKRPRYVVHLSEALKARDLFFLRLIQPAHVAGLDDSLKCIDIKLGSRTAGRHFSEKPVPLLDELGIPTDDRHYWLPTSAADRSQVLAYWPSNAVIGFCPFGASRHRCFSDQKIVMTIRALLSNAASRNLMVSVLLIATAEQSKRLKDLIEAHDLSAKVFIQPTSSLTEFIEQVRACSGVVSVDTSVVHVAAGLDKPLLAIYNPPGLSSSLTPSNYASWHPNSDKARTFFADVAASARIDAFDDERFKAAIDEWFLSVLSRSY